MQVRKISWPPRQELLPESHTNPDMKAYQSFLSSDSERWRCAFYIQFLWDISKGEFAWTKLHGFCAIFDVGFWVDHFDLMVANGCWPRWRGLDRKCLQNSFDEFVWQSVRVDNNNSIGVAIIAGVFYNNNNNNSYVFICSWYLFYFTDECILFYVWWQRFGLYFAKHAAMVLKRVCGNFTPCGFTLTLVRTLQFWWLFLHKSTVCEGFCGR